MPAQFFHLSYPWNEAGKWVLEEEEEEDGRFTVGDVLWAQRLDRLVYPRLKLFVPGESRDLTFTCHAVPVFSLRAAKMLVGLCDHDVQVIPARIENGPSTFFVVNVLSRIDCLDEEHSVLGTPLRNPTPLFGKFGGVWQVAINGAKVGDSHLFRVDSCPQLLIVSDTFRRLWTEGQFTGATFADVQTV